MKKLLDIFYYIKKYQYDTNDTLIIALVLVLLKKDKNLTNNSVIELSKSANTNINTNMNLNKLIKDIDKCDTTISDVDSFLNTIALKKSINNLYPHATPTEVNELIIGLANINDKDEIYNPCCGAGSLFIALKKSGKKFSLYGEELDEKNFNISKLICDIIDIENSNIFNNDILEKPTFKSSNRYKKFDKILCNPPFSTNLRHSLLRDDRFLDYGTFSKNSPEAIFLLHSLSHLKERLIFLIRSSSLSRGGLDGRIRQTLLGDRKIEAIIELPKNIVPYRQEHTSILIISNSYNMGILYIDADSEQFHKKDGRYNRLTNIDKILDTYKSKQITKYSKMVYLDEIDENDLRVSRYLDASINSSFDKKLSSIKEVIFRGKRVYGSSKDDDVEYYDLGVGDFVEYGFINKISSKRYKGSIKAIKDSLLKPYDIVMPLRGVNPKISIIGDIANSFVVANAGVVIIRLNCKENAIGFYMYLLSKTGKDSIKRFYENKELDATIKINNLDSINIPKHFSKSSIKIFYEIDEISKKIDFLKLNIENIINSST